MTTEKRSGWGAALGGAGGLVAGFKVGATAGTFLMPGLGTALGGLAGAMYGMFAGANHGAEHPEQGALLALGALALPMSDAATDAVYHDHLDEMTLNPSARLYTMDYSPAELPPR